jgi:CDP-diacylglycerol--glycerol-3-phosphate 3-phosphatidyltransferase
MSWNTYVSHWSALHGGYDVRGASPLVQGWIRMAYGSAKLLAAARVTPTAMTLIGLLISVGVPLTVRPGGGWPIAAAGLVTASAVADSLDGALAVVSRRASRLGNLYDSVADRISEACWLLAFALLGAPLWLVILSGALAWLQEYIRARAMASGMRGIGVVTVAERPTRILLAVFGLVFAGIGGLASPDLAIGTVTVTSAIWAVLACVAMLQLLLVVREELR